MPCISIFFPFQAYSNTMLFIDLDRSDIHIHRRHDLDRSQLRSIVCGGRRQSEKAVLLGQSDVKSEESGVVAREDGDEIESGLESLELEVVDGVNDSGGKGLDEKCLIQKWCLCR
ncbi:unnamed protein product [Brassica oleracea]